MLRRLALIRTDVSEERIASIIRVTRIGELSISLQSTSVASYCQCFSSLAEGGDNYLWNISSYKSHKA
jgi:hypothetical protein